MNTILTDDEHPKLPAPLKRRREQRGNGAYCLLPAYSEEEMRAYADARESAVLAKLAQQEPFGYFRAEPFGWTDCAESDEDAVPLYAAPVAQQADRQRVPTIEELTEKIASMLHGTYHCTRVWEAWNVGTMSEEDFGPVDESDTPAEIAAEIHTMLAAAPEAPAQASAVDERDRKDAERYRFIRNADRSDFLISYEDLLAYAGESLDEAIDDAMQEEARAALAQKGGAA